METIKQVWGEKIEPYANYDRVRVYYVKNNRDQSAVFMNYNREGGRDYKIIEDNHAPRNRLNNEETQAIMQALNKDNLLIKERSLS